MAETKKCRICKETNGVMMPLFTKTEGRTEIYFKLLTFTDDNIYADDIQSSYLCHKCIYKVEIAYALKQQCAKLFEPTENWCVRCCFCNAETTSCGNLESHMKVAHPNKESFNCSLCDVKFNLCSLYLSHCLRIHRRKDFSCSVCGIVFQYEHSLNEHEKEHNQPSLFCKYCPKSFNNKILLDLHQRVHSAKTCQQCFAIFLDDDELEKHEETCSKVFVCHFCDEVFSERKSLIEHVVSHHQKLKLPCDKCQKTFTSLNELHNHDCTCRCLPGSIGCGLCNVSIMTKTERKRYSCQYCTKTFKAKCALDAHLRTHTGESPYSCTECPKKFRQLTNLKSHMFRAHKSDKKNNTQAIPYNVETATFNLLQPSPFTIDPNQVFEHLELDYSSVDQSSHSTYH